MRVGICQDQGVKWIPWVGGSLVVKKIVEGQSPTEIIEFEP